MNKKLLISFVLVCVLIFQSLAQDRTISGKVTSSEDGSPLPGVSVGVKGSTKGTVTASDGTYKINISGTSTLTFSFVGFKKTTTPVGVKSVVDITLISDASEID